MFVVVLLGVSGAVAQNSSSAPASASAAGANDASSTQAHAMEQLDHGKSADAIATLQALATAHPDQKNLQHDLGLAYYRTGKLVEARKSFERAIAADPKDMESVQLQGLTLYRLGQPQAAIPYLQRVQEFSPNANADASHVLGLCYLNSRSFDEARRAFAAEYSLQPESGAAYLVLAKMMMAGNLPDQGAEAATKALTVSPSLPLAHFVLGEVALYKSDVELAIKEFEAERAINPAYAPVYERLGDAYLRSNKFDAAQETLMQSLALDTSSTGPFILMGKVLLRKNDPENAATYLKHAEKMDPSNYIAHTLLGQAYRSLGEEAQAKEEFATAANIHAASQLKLQPVR
ncbi:MAG TPA: tetratricopeptide repeat protein [Terracidiphilus sp.]